MKREQLNWFILIGSMICLFYVLLGSEEVKAWSYLERLGALASTALGAKRIATAVRNGAGDLEVIVWEVQYDGSVKRLGTGHGGQTTQVAIAALADQLEIVGGNGDDKNDLKPGGHRFVTAARTEAGNLKVTAWDVDKDGQVTRRGSGETGEIHGEFAVVTFSTDRVVTAVRDSEDRLKLISWHVSSAGSIQRLKDASAGVVGQLSLATYDSYPPDTGRLATAVTTQAGNLKVIAWSIDDAGAFQRLGDAEGGR